jgi:CRISPR-associated endonuclease/helicase Cas3
MTLANFIPRGSCSGKWQMNANLIAHIRQSDHSKQPLRDHLTEVSSLAGKFAEKLGLKTHGELIGLLHDLGKASNRFQNYIRSAEGLIDPDQDDYIDPKAQKGKIDHSSAGAQYVFSQVSNLGSEAMYAAQILSLCIASHHSGIIDCLSADGENNFNRRMIKADEKTQTKEAILHLDQQDCDRLADLLTGDMVKQLNAKLVLLKEHNDSKETLVFKYGLLLRFLFSCLIDADRISTADFEMPANAKLRNKNNYRSWDELIERFGTKVFNSSEINSIRARISDACFEFSRKPKGLYQLTVPTGGGKTFASLRFALHHAKHHGMERIVYVIPYTSIIDQNAQEIRKILEDKDDLGNYLDKVVLEHHSNLTPDEESRRQNILAQNWDAPIVFTTQVQFLESLYSTGTRGARRLHQLANAVIIFDEVQTIPVRCVHLFNLAVRFLVHGCGSTAILCTATQPLLDKIEPEQRALVIAPSQQIISDVGSLFQSLKRVDVRDERKIGGWTEMEIVTLAIQQCAQNQSVLIVVNTKKTAQNLYRALKSISEVKVFHLSTNMCPAHRLNILNTIKTRLERQEPTICISTQLIEAGVDIDFGAVIRYLAGLDSIAQAAGRCNRHGLRMAGQAYIINPETEDLSKLEDIRVARENAERVLDEFKDDPQKFDNDILSPKAMNLYYSYYFYQRKDKMNYPVSSNSVVRRSDNLFDLFSANPLSVQEHLRIHDSDPTIPLKQSFQTAARAFEAIDSPTRGIVVPYGNEGPEIINELCSAFDLEKQTRLLRKAQRYSVNVFAHLFNALAKENALHEAQEGVGVFYLDSRYYSNEIGLSTEIVNEPEPQTFTGGLYG